MKDRFLLIILIIAPLVVNAQWNDNGGSITTNDKVGIGISSPSSSLEIKTPASSSEKPFKITVSDAPNDYFEIFNGTAVPGQFIPSLRGYHVSDNRTGFSIMSEIHPDMDNGTSPLMSFNARRSGTLIQTRPLFQWVNYDEVKMIMLANGSLGIGTAEPTARLEIFSNLTIGTPPNFSNAHLKLSNGSQNLAIDPNQIYTNKELNFQTTGDNHIDIWTNDTRRVRITGNGNVGIGTTSPDSKLTVAGSIHAQEIKVTTTAGADFVFEADYPLRSLEETEQFIKENKHLPDIPSAEEMEEEGITLGEMNVKLLQKIEELTLHQIELMKKIKWLETKIEKLENP